MASIHVQAIIDAPAKQVWAAVGEENKSFASVPAGSRLEGEDVHVATFTNGLEVRERVRRR